MDEIIFHTSHSKKTSCMNLSIYIYIYSQVSFDIRQCLFIFVGQTWFIVSMYFWSSFIFNIIPPTIYDHRSFILYCVRSINEAPVFEVFINAKRVALFGYDTKIIEIYILITSL